MKQSLTVVKFGGSCLSSPETISKAAAKIAGEVEKNRRIVVVVSALKGTTDSLLKTAKESTANRISKQDLDEILSLGERTAVPLMASALKSAGLNSLPIDPTTEAWPIFTDANYGDAEVDMKKTKQAMDTLIKPLIEKGYVLVFPGFIGRSPEGRITTLGRGGSDITAVLLGSTLDAEEVVFVKDVGGVLSADPKRVQGAQRIDTLNAEEAFTLTLAGAKILHPRALRYKHSGLTLRVVGFDEPDFSSGTVIRGEIQSDLQAALDDSKVSMIAVVGEELKSSNATFKMLSEAMTSGSRIVGITLAESSLLLYAQSPGPLVERLHEMIKTTGIAKAIHCFEPLAMIVVSGPDLERIPGVVDGVVGPLAKCSINLYGIVTISSSIRLFVPWDSREQALTLINANIKEFKNNKGNGA